MSDPINPEHYKVTGLEPIAVIEAWGLGFCLGNTVKYIGRAGRKGSYVEDLKKARWYLDRAIQQAPDNNGEQPPTTANRSAE